MDGVAGGTPEFRDSYLSLVNSIGADLRARGDFREARKHDDDSRRLHTEEFGPDDPRTLRVLSNLAVDYGLVSDYPGSRELHNQVFQEVMRRGSAKAGQAFVVSSWGGLARAVRLCGQYQIACDVGEEAYAHGVKELGADHPWTLRTTKDFSIALRRAGQYDRALDVARDLDTRYVRLYGRAHPDSLASAMCLANILRTVGEIAEAYELAAETLRLYPDIYGREHPYHYGCMGNLAILERIRDNNVERARQLNETALEGLENKLERDHHYSLTVAVNLATDLAALGDLKSAINLGRGTLRRLGVVLGEDHPATKPSPPNKRPAIIR
jgi:tetratricopeptide (TPR) repeat protein